MLSPQQDAVSFLFFKFLSFLNFLTFVEVEKIFLRNGLASDAWEPPPPKGEYVCGDLGIFRLLGVWLGLCGRDPRPLKGSTVVERLGIFRLLGNFHFWDKGGAFHGDLNRMVDKNAKKSNESQIKGGLTQPVANFTPKKDGIQYKSFYYAK